MNVDRTIASAQRMIRENGEPCVWLKPAAPAVGSDPWRDDRDGAAPTEHDVQIAWFSPRDVGRGTEVFLATLLGSEVPEGVEIGLMAGGLAFDPVVSDSIERSDGRTIEITSIDRLAPNGTPLLYFVKVAL